MFSKLFVKRVRLRVPFSKGLLFLGIFLSIIRFSFAQQHSLRDLAEIKRSAQLSLIGYQGVLNHISLPGISESEINEAIMGSYEFYSENALIEMDFIPGGKQLSGKQEQNVKEYLNHFHKWYPKSKKETVHFSDFQFSHLKQKDYLYIRVKFTAHYEGEFKDSGSFKRVSERLAELRVEKNNGEWNAYITSISFFNPTNPIESTDGDIELNDSIVDDGTIALKIHEQNSSSDEGRVRGVKRQSFTQVKNAEEAIRRGGQADEVRDYKMAKYYYVQALQWNSEEPTIKDKIKRLEKILYRTSKLAGPFFTGKYEEAIRGYGSAIQSDPKNADFYYGRGRCYERLQDFPRALTDYSKAVELDGNFIDALHARAQLYFQGGKYPEALKDYDQIISNAGYTAAYYPERARTKMLTGDFDGAVKDLDAAIKLNPGYAVLYFEKGISQLKQQQTEQAILSFSKAIEKDPLFVEAYFQRGFAYINQEDVKMASVDFEKVREMGITDDQHLKIDSLTTHYFLAGEKAMKEADYPKALSCYVNVNLISPSFPNAWLRKGDSHYFLHDYENAVLSYTQASKLDSISYAFYKRGLAFQKAGDEVSAKKDFRRFATIGRKTVETAEEKAAAWYALGYAQLMAEQYINALESFNEAIRLKRNYPEALISSATAHFALKSFQNAIKDIISSFEAWGGFEKVKDPSVFLLLGQAYEAVGDNDAARKTYDYLIDSIDSKFEPAYRQRAQLFKRMRYYKSAHQDITFILTLNKTTQHDIDLLTDKGLMELYSDNFEDACLSFNQVLSIKNDHPWALFGKACALAGQDKLEESLELYKKAFQTKQIEWIAIKDDPVIKYLNRKKAFKELFEASF